MAIRSFKDKDTEKVFSGRKPKKLPQQILDRALAKLLSIHYAGAIEDLQVPPGNKLHRLSGDREGQWAIRVNEQYRICFDWHDGNADNVEITDYH